MGFPQCRGLEETLLNQHPDQYSVNTLSAFDQQWVDSWPNVDQLMSFDQKLVDETDCPPRCVNQGVNTPHSKLAAILVFFCLLAN